MIDRRGRQLLSGYRLRDPDHLVALLRQAQITQGPVFSRIADQLGCARSTVSGLLAGNHTAAIGRWVDLADALGCDLALIPREDAPEAEVAKCSKCGGALSACVDCGKPAQCGEPWCDRHSPDSDWGAPPTVRQALVRREGA